jgi:hypothetical protein
MRPNPVICNRAPQQTMQRCEKPLASQKSSRLLRVFTRFMPAVNDSARVELP